MEWFVSQEPGSAMKQIVLFGLGMIADVAYHHIVRDAAFEIAAFACDGDWLDAARHSRLGQLGVPVVAFESIEDSYPPDAYAMFVAIGYHELNQLRADRCRQATAKGYELVSYVSTRADCGPWAKIGKNCLILDGVGVQPGVSIGDNVSLWNNTLIGHHSNIGDHCWIAAGTTIGGKATLGERCFVGLGATIAGDLLIGAESFIGAGCLLTRSAAARSVFVQRDTELFRLDSRAFLRMTRLAAIGPDNSR